MGQKMPDIIFVLGNSCSGKSNLIIEMKRRYSFLQSFDDYWVLKEFFELDSILNTYLFFPWWIS